jgi:hypothetical protein
LAQEEVEFLGGSHSREALPFSSVTNKSPGALFRRLPLTMARAFCLVVLNPWGTMKFPDNTVVREQEYV